MSPILFPTKVVLINLEGLLTNGDKIFADKLPCLFFNSMSSLLAEIKAISIPAKNAENKIEQIIMMKECCSIESKIGKCL